MYLLRSSDYLRFEQLVPLWYEVELDSFPCTVQRDSSEKQDDQQHVGKRRCEVHDLQVLRVSSLWFRISVLSAAWVTCTFAFKIAMCTWICDTWGRKINRSGMGRKWHEVSIISLRKTEIVYLSGRPDAFYDAQEAENPSQQKDQAEFPVQAIRVFNAIGSSQHAVAETRFRKNIDHPRKRTFLFFLQRSDTENSTVMTMNARVPENNKGRCIKLNLLFANKGECLNKCLIFVFKHMKITWCENNSTGSIYSRLCKLVDKYTRCTFHVCITIPSVSSLHFFQLATNKINSLQKGQVTNLKYSSDEDTCNFVMLSHFSRSSFVVTFVHVRTSETFLQTASRTSNFLNSSFFVQVKLNHTSPFELQLFSWASERE